MIGDGATKLVERGLAATGGDPATLMETHRAFLAIYEANASNLTRPIPALSRRLRPFGRKGMPLAVVTNKPAAATATVLESLDLARFFKVVVGGDTLPQRKPHPAQILHALEALGIPPRRRSWWETTIMT